MGASVGADLSADLVEYDGRGRVITTYSASGVDDSTSGSFATTGTWSSNTDGGLLDTYKTADSTDGASATATATWTFDNLIVGDAYEVYILWASVANGADDAPVAIYEESTATTAIWTGTVDQSAGVFPVPGSMPFSDLGLVKLGSTITLTDSTLVVQLANNTGETGEVISADAVYVVRSGPMSRYTYDSDGMLTTTTDADDNETTYTYDALGRVIAVTQADPDGAGTDYESPVTRTYYNSTGQVSGTLGPDGRTDTYGYDDFGRQTTTQTGQTITPSHDGYSEASGTWTAASGGLLGSCQTASTVTGTATAAATWTFTDLVPGEEYEVYVSWTADGSNASDAHFSVYLDSTSGTLVAESDLDQTADPDQEADFPGLGSARFELLASYLLHEDDSTTLVVQLSNDSASAGDTIAADAVYVVRKGANSESVYDFAGRLVATLDAAGNRTDYVYDDMGRRTEVVLPDPDGDGPLTRPRTVYVYDAASRLIETVEYAGDELDYDQRGAEFYRVLGDSVDIGAYEGIVGPETSTYVVDTLVDESDGDYSTGDLSLREAIELANGAAGHDLITFDAGLSGTIELSIGQLEITSDMTIEGPGSGTITVDANGTSGTNRRVFDVTGEVTGIISGLTLTGGYVNNGGAVYSGTDSDLTLSELVITGNHATSSGGGVYTGSAESLVVEDCTITANSAVSYGGGIAALSDRVYIYDTTISSNTVEDNYGAGMAAFYETLEIVDCVISDNVFSDDSTALRYGAGLFVADGISTRITGTTIANNKADGAGEYNATRGGGIAGINDGTDVYITDCTIENNESDTFGGGIYMLWSKLHVTATTIEGNEAASGGGVYGYYASLTIADSLIADNDATNGAGMMVSTGAGSSLTGVTVSGNTATGYGGGLYIYSTSPDLTEVVHCTVTDNTAGHGGGIYAVNNGYVRLDNTIVADNTATSSYPDVRGTFDSNSSNNLIGIDTGLFGGISDGVRGNLVGTSGTPIDPGLNALAQNGGPTRTHMPQSSSPVLDAGSTMLATTYYDGRGENFYRVIGVGTDIGAVEYNSLNLLVDELTDGAGMTLEEAIAAANANPGHDTITFSAGLDLSAAIDITLSAELDVTGNLTIIGPGADLLTISGNDTVRIFDLAEGTNVRLVGLTFTDGSAAGAGGAIRSLADELTLEACQVLDSTATTDGGGIYASGQVNLLESTLAGNSAIDGGALMLDGADVFLRQATIAENSATHGGGIALENSATATILQSTIVENTASASGGGLKITSGNVLVHNTLIADNSATTVYPDVDGPLLADSSYNLVSDGTGMSGISDGSQGNQVGTSGSPIDAKLGDLGDHGGPVQTVPLRVGSPALDAGSDELAVTRLGRSTSVVYDALGRVAEEIATDPDGIGSASAPVTTNAYDANGNLVSVTDPLGSVTGYTYDNLGRKTSETDAEEGVTEYTYDASGRMTSLTDPEENTTYWSYDPLGRVATETINVNSTDLVRTFCYDARGNLTRKIDRNGRVIDYAYDSLSRQTSETWYDDLAAADAQQNAQKTYSTTYDDAGRVATIGDGDYDFEYTYSILGNLTSTTQDLTGLTDDVEFTYGYDVLGRKTSVAATIGSTDDYANTYSYDNLGRITQITQEGVSGGNAVAEKRVDFGYNDDGTRATISRFADLAGSTAVAETEKVFDELGRVTDIVHERAATEFADYDLTWDAASRITDIDFDFLGTNYDDDASYTYDDTSQLTDADHTTQADEDYVYDDNGNRTLVDGTDTYTTGDQNRLTSDGTYYYTYDNEGNRTGKYSDASHTTPVEKYFWDHRNRMTKVELYVSGELDTTVEYAYDHDNRMYSRIVDATSDSRQIFVRDNDQVVLVLADDNVGDVTGSDLTRRALWQQDAVDQLLAEEHIGDDTYWMLTDHLGTVRDIVAYESATDTTALEQHNEFSSFGVLLNTPTIESLALYTGRFYEYLTQKQYNRERWYDLSTGQWMSVDPIGFRAGDMNLYRYAENCPTIRVDASGLQEGCPVCQRPMVPVEPTPWVPVQPTPWVPVEPARPTLSNPGQPSGGGGASVHISPVGPPVAGTQYYHSCIQVKKEEIRTVVTCTPKQVWTQLTPGTNYTDPCGRQWHTPGQWGLMTIWERQETRKRVVVTYAIELKMGPVSGIGGPPAGSTVIGSGPVGGGLIGDLPNSSWSIVIREGECKGPGTPITPPSGSSQSQLVQAIINAAHQVGQTSSGYQYHLDGRGNTCNSVTWEILTQTGSGVSIPVAPNQLPGWRSRFGPEEE